MSKLLFQNQKKSLIFQAALYEILLALDALQKQKSPLKHLDKLHDYLECLDVPHSSKKMERVIEKLLKKTSLYERDASALFFLLKNHERFSQLLGENKMRQVLSSLFSGGIPELNEWLQQSFARKGYFHLLPRIAFFCDQLKPDTFKKKLHQDTQLRVKHA